MEVISIDVVLRIDIRDQELYAHVIFINNTSNTLLLDKYTICFDGKFYNNVFEVTDGRGKKVSYSGIMMKRVLNPESFIEFKVGGKIHVSVNLSKTYKVQKGKKYFIKYSAFNPVPSEDPDPAIIKMESNTVEFLYK